jgi:hypothetical protein
VEDANARRNLALALFMTGRNQEALAVARQALNLALAKNDRKLAAELQEMLAAYSR